MKRIRMWFYKQSLKDKSVLELIERDKMIDSIAYGNWVGSLNKTGFPKNDSGSMMDCWQLYNYFYNSDKRNSYILHSSLKTDKK